MIEESYTTATTARPPMIRITVEGVEAAEFAATPTLRFRLRLDQTGGPEIRSVALHTRIHIVPGARTYDGPTRERLAELFGAPESWSRTPRSVLWAEATAQVPAFTGGAGVDLPVACTYDFEVAAAKYLHALPGGEVPLEFLFAGTIFYLDGDRLQAARIPWDTEARFRMPVRAWKDVMDRYFPGTAWLRLDREVFDRLYAYKVRHTLPTWEDVLDALLPGDAGGNGGGRDD